jgi:HD-like signal output (HDOD) protein
MSDSVSRYPDLAELRRFRFLDDLDDDRLLLLGKSLRMLYGSKRRRLMARGDRADYSLLLLEGELILTGEDGGRFRVVAGNELASGPIAPDIPRRYHVDCAGDVRYVEIDNRLLRELARPSGGAALPRLAAGTSGGDPCERLIQAIRADLEADRLELPSLPEVAIRVGKAIDDSSSDARQVAAIVQSDPAMTVKLIKVANSAFYASAVPAATCADAVTRLGFNTTYKLVLSFALREVFRGGAGAPAARMRELWRHSVRVSALCYALSTHLGELDREVALLCGLVHDIGLVPVYAYAVRFPEVASDPAALDRLRHAFRAELGELILDRWGFLPVLVACASDAEDWLRDAQPSPDYCDLLLVAQVLGDYADGQTQDLPDLNSMPAYLKLGLGPFDPERVQTLLEPMQDRLNFVESSLGG